MKAKYILVILGGCVLIGGRAAASGFDPSHYLKGQVAASEPAAPRPTALAIVRLDGRRYHRYTAGEASVFLPAIGERPNLAKDTVLCPAHSRVFGEVLLLRDGLQPMALSDGELTIIGRFIEDCRSGRHGEAALGLDRLDGDVLRIEVKEPVPAERPRADTKLMGNGRYRQQ